MKTRFDQKMVTIEISDHHMDEKEMLNVYECPGRELGIDND